MGNSYAFRLGLWGIAGLEKASRGDGRGEVKGDAVDDFPLLKDGGMPEETREVTPSRGEDEAGDEVPREICHGAGDGLLRTVCRKGGGDDAVVGPSR